WRAAALAALAAFTATLAGCAMFSSPADEVFSYEQMKRQIEGPPPEEYRSKFASSPGPRQAKGLVDSVAPPSFTDSLKKATGRGPKPDKARERYQLAEAAYTEAINSSGNERRAKFEKAGDLFADA